MNRVVIFLSMFLPLVFTPLQVSPAVQYTIMDLGTLGAPSAATRAINDNGEVVGFLTFRESGHFEDHAFMWKQGNMTDLVPIDGRECGALAINNSGLIVGGVDVPDNDFVACYWEDGSLTEIGTLGGNYSVAWGVNSSGQIVGMSRDIDGIDRAFIWQNGFMTNLGTMEGGTFSFALDINESGRAVGYGNIAGPQPFLGFVWQNGIMTPLEGLTSAHAINNLDQIVGFSKIAEEETHAFMWEDGSLTDLGIIQGSLTSVAHDINDLTQVVGYLVMDDRSAHAMLWKNGVMSDLNDLIPANSGWILEEAYAINNRGQIAGHGSFGGEIHPFLLTPVPEPGVLLIAVSLLVLWIKRSI
ncbi:MAG TPA: HAF repeat-containing protein [candidate division Zixibacteria bacterium]|nr:HAF repeat-containing protein [candidate division Zixibacteria bacterium]